MADFDPMIFRTRGNSLLAPVGSYDSLILNGKLEKWADVNAMADNWLYSNANAVTPTLSRRSETRTGGNGSYCQRIQYTTPAAGALGFMYQDYVLLGEANLDALGHLSQTFTVSVWVINSGAGLDQLNLRIDELNSAGAVIAGSQTQYGLTGSWVQYTHSRALTQALCRKVRIKIDLQQTGTENVDLRIDDAELYQAYTFARNPSVPDEGEIIVPGRNFARTIGGSLLRGRPASVTAKWRKQLHFGLIGKPQVEALKSLWLQDSVLEWVPNHPLLPALMEVRLVGEFDFHLLSSSAGVNHYGGSLSVEEY